MVSFKHIGTFLALTWLRFTLAEERPPYYLVNSNQNSDQDYKESVISVTSPGGNLKVVPFSGSDNLDEKFKIVDVYREDPQGTGPFNSFIIESLKYPGHYISCNNKSQPCKIHQAATHFVIRGTTSALYFKTFDDYQLEVTDDKEKSVFVKKPDGSWRQYFSLLQTH